MRSGAARATSSPRTSKAAGRTTVPQRPAAKSATRTTKRRTTTSRRAAARRLSAPGLSLPVEGAGSLGPEIVTAHDPLAAAALVERAGGGLVARAERDREHRDAQRGAERARDRATGDQEHVGHHGARLVQRLAASR